MEEKLATADQVIQATQQYQEDRISRSSLDSTYYSYLANTDKYRLQNSKYLFTEFIRIIFANNEIKNFYYVMSALFRLTMIPDALTELIRVCINDDSLTKETKHFILYQCQSFRFLYPAANTSTIRDLMDDLYDSVYYSYLNEVSDLCEWIPLENRNKDLIVVITSQVLNLTHGPTKTLLDRCYTIEKKLNKHVYIINTADELTTFGAIDWFDCRIGNYIHEFSSYEYLSYKDTKFPYFQCENQMPQIAIIREIMKVIAEEKPWSIISIGEINITADLCSKIIPALSVTLEPSERSQTRTTFQMTGHRIDQEIKAWLKKHNFPESHIIEGLFTSAFKPQSHSISRKDLGFSTDWIICLVVGARLYAEVDEVFLNVVSTLALNKIHTVFMGNFQNYDEQIKNNDLLTEYTRYIGFQDDALSVIECCDIYLNPNRLGGGTSAAEALFKGLPVITLDYGDVAIGSGKEFCVNSYDDMCKTAIKLATDKEYYKIMREKAINRAAKLMDTDGEFIRIIYEMESRSEFR